LRLSGSASYFPSHSIVTHPLAFKYTLGLYWLAPIFVVLLF
jgi:hypothetical protein